VTKKRDATLEIVVTAIVVERVEIGMIGGEIVVPIAAVVVMMFPVITAPPVFMVLPGAETNHLLGTVTIHMDRPETRLLLDTAIYHRQDTVTNLQQDTVTIRLPVVIVEIWTDEEITTGLLVETWMDQVSIMVRLGAETTVHRQTTLIAKDRHPTFVVHLRGVGMVLHLGTVARHRKVLAIAIVVQEANAVLTVPEIAIDASTVLFSKFTSCTRTGSVF